MSMEITLMVCLLAVGALFLALAVVFAVRREKACGLLSGFNLFTPAQQARYDRAAIARDYGRLFAGWAAAAFLGAGLSLLVGLYAFIGVFVLILLTCARIFHIDPEKAFAKYKIVK